MQLDLVPLHNLVKSAGDVRLLQIPGYPKEQKGWDVEWEIEDDVALLKGIYRYGLGSWEAIKMDPDYGLAEKVSSIHLDLAIFLPLFHTFHGNLHG